MIYRVVLNRLYQLYDYNNELVLVGKPKEISNYMDIPLQMVYSMYYQNLKYRGHIIK